MNSNSTPLFINTLNYNFFLLSQCWPPPSNSTTTFFFLTTTDNQNPPLNLAIWQLQPPPWISKKLITWWWLYRRLTKMVVILWLFGCHPLIIGLPLLFSCLLNILSMSTEHKSRLICFNDKHFPKKWIPHFWVFRAIKLGQNEIMFHLLGKTLSLRLKLMRYDINKPNAPNDGGSIT